VQRIFNCDKIQNTNLTQDKVLSTVINRSSFYISTYRNYVLVKTDQCFGPPCTNSTGHERDT